MSDYNFPNSTAGRTREQHRADHDALHKRAQACIYASSVGNLQEALDTASASRKPLVIMPGSYVLTAPLVLNDCDRLHVSAYRATFSAGANLPALLEVKDCTRCTWRGGWFTVPTGRVVDNAVYVYRETTQATRNALYDVTVEGDYSTGLRVGKMGNGNQCDHMYFTNVECIGRSKPGQVGVYAGTGNWGNNLNHTFTNLMCSMHETHVKVDATNVFIENAFFARSDVDLSIRSTQFVLRGCRSELAQRFLVTSGPSGYAAQVTIEDVDWHGEQIAADGEWLRFLVGGCLRLSNVRAISTAFPPRIRAAPGGKLLLRADGLMSEAAYADAFVLGSQAAVQLGSYMQLDETGSVEVITT